VCLKPTSRAGSADDALRSLSETSEINPLLLARQKADALPSWDPCTTGGVADSEPARPVWSRKDEHWRSARVIKWRDACVFDESRSEVVVEELWKQLIHEVVEQEREMSGLIWSWENERWEDWKSGRGREMAENTWSTSPLRDWVVIATGPKDREAWRREKQKEKREQRGDGRGKRRGRRGVGAEDRVLDKDVIISKMRLRPEDFEERNNF
jgi:hypothetical protein